MHRFQGTKVMLWLLTMSPLGVISKRGWEEVLGNGGLQATEQGGREGSSDVLAGGSSV